MIINIINLLKNFNAKINWTKSAMNPSRHIELLGYRIQDHSIHMPVVKIHKLIALINKFSHKSSLTKRERARILGTINFVSMRSKEVQDMLTPCYDVLKYLSSWGQS